MVIYDGREKEEKNRRRRTLPPHVFNKGRKKRISPNPSSAGARGEGGYGSRRGGIRYTYKKGEGTYIYSGQLGEVGELLVKKQSSSTEVRAKFSNRPGDIKEKRLPSKISPCGNKKRDCKGSRHLQPMRLARTE